MQIANPKPHEEEPFVGQTEHLTGEQVHCENYGPLHPINAPFSQCHI